MSGSNLKFELPNNDNLKHDMLIHRDYPLQHPLQAIYRELDGKDLDTLLKELDSKERSVLYEQILITDPETTVINLTKFTYNMARDVLYVNAGGIQVFEGTDNDFVKTTPTQIKFNYSLPNPITVYILLLGTISTESFGDDIYNALSKFTQLVDVPKDYHGSEGKYTRVNDSGTGLVFSSVKASNELLLVEYTASVSSGGYFEGWIPFFKSGIIKGIKVFGSNQLTGDLTLSLWTGPKGEWVYYSGKVTNILWDIMDIPYIDKSGQDSIYARIDNMGPATIYTIQIYIVL